MDKNIIIFVNNEQSNHVQRREKAAKQAQCKSNLTREENTIQQDNINHIKLIKAPIARSTIFFM